MWGIPVFDHQFDPYPGEFDYHFGPELGQGAFLAQKFGDLRRISGVEFTWNAPWELGHEFELNQMTFIND
jgi:hypothetical protein